VLLQLAGQIDPMNEINSDIGSDYGSSSVFSYNTGFSEFKNNETEEVFDNIQEDELEKYFLSLCLKYKIQTGRKDLKMTDLFKQCKDE